MSLSAFRAAICWMMIAVTPATLLGADAGGAMLHGQGPVWLNGKPLTRSSAVFPGDLIQTKPESLATLEVSGSSIVVLPNSLVKFQGNSVSLEHGVVSVGTSQGVVAQANAVVVTPASTKWTEFEVSNAEGSIQVVARKGEISVNCGKNMASLSDGEEVTPDDSGHCRKRRRSASPPTAGQGSIFTDPWVQAGAVVAGGVVVCLLLCSSSKPFVSQWKP
jgi:hypothetical protein